MCRFVCADQRLLCSLDRNHGGQVSKYPKDSKAYILICSPPEDVRKDALTSSYSEKVRKQLLTEMQPRSRAWWLASGNPLRTVKANAEVSFG